MSCVLVRQKLWISLVDYRGSCTYGAILSANTPTRITATSSRSTYINRRLTLLSMKRLILESVFLSEILFAINIPRSLQFFAHAGIEDGHQDIAGNIADNNQRRNKQYCCLHNWKVHDSNRLRDDCAHTWKEFCQGLFYRYLNFM